MTELTKMAGTHSAQSHNKWMVLNNMWNVTDLVYGRDYQISSLFDKTDLTEKTTWQWSLPENTKAWSVIRGYPDLQFGASPWGINGVVKDPAAVFPIQSKDIKDFDIKYDVTFGGDKGGYNVSYDIWFTSVPNGNTSQMTTELMIWLHRGDLTMGSKKIGRYEDAQFSGDIYYSAASPGHANYIALIADTDHTKGTIDLDAIIKKMQGLGVMNQAEYLASIQFGAEVVEGTGFLSINDHEFNFVQNVNGVDVAKRVTGTSVDVSSTIDGTNGNDILHGDGLVNYMNGGHGNDVLHGGNGNDILHGGTGNDVIVGQNGNDLVYGDEGNDQLWGNDGNDKVYGGVGNDILWGHEGDDLLNGEDGDDWIHGGEGKDTLLGGAGNDTIFGVQGDDAIYGGDGNDKLFGHSGNDAVYGDAGNDEIHGSDGNDLLEGGTGDDILYGEAGTDILFTSVGKDYLAGGAGADIFILTKAGLDGIDRIHFIAGDMDVIDFSDLLDNGTDLTAQSILDFVHASRIGKDTVLSVDADGAANGTNFVDAAILVNQTNVDLVQLVLNGNIT